MAKIPVKLARDPIIQAIAQIRFAEAEPSKFSLLPGLFYQKFAKQFPDLVSEQTQLELQVVGQAIKAGPTYSLSGPDGLVVLSPFSATMYASMPYKGWDKFSAVVKAVFSDISSHGLYGDIERISVRYVNRLEGELGENHLRMIKLSLTVGDVNISTQPLGVRAEFSRDAHSIVLVNIAAQATINTPDGKQSHGLIVDVDAIANGPFQKGAEEISATLDQVHMIEKETFFSLLTQETLDRYEPKY